MVVIHLQREVIKTLFLLENANLLYAKHFTETC